jgi:hypothetical protein
LPLLLSGAHVRVLQALATGWTYRASQQEHRRRQKKDRGRREKHCGFRNKYGRFREKEGLSNQLCN